jgi:hypothetical protein
MRRKNAKTANLEASRRRFGWFKLLDRTWWQKALYGAALHDDL